MDASVKDNVVYYDTTSKQLTYGAAPTGGIEAYVNSSSYYDGSLYRTFPNPSTGLANLEARGTWIEMVAGEAITAFYAVHCGSDGKVYMADAEASIYGMPVIGLAAGGAVAQNATGKFLLNGVVYNSGWNWTPGRPVYLFSTIDGCLGQTPPSAAGQCVQVLGIATSADSMIWNPSPDYIVLK